MKPLSLFILAVFCFGCVVGPSYRQPVVCLPEQFKEKKEGTASEDDLAEWWKQFQDPTLDHLVEIAVGLNYDVRLAVEKICQARAQYRLDRSRLWPEIDFNAAAARSRISQNLFPAVPPAATPATQNGTAANSGSGFLPTYLNLFRLGLDAIWELDLFGKFRHAKNAAVDLAEASYEEANQVLISLISEVAVDYVNIRALQHQIALGQKQVELDAQQLDIIRALVQIGLADDRQIDPLISQLESDRAALFTLETSFKQTVYALSYLLSQSPESAMEWVQHSAPIPSGWNRVPVGLPSDLLRRRPDIRAAERRLAASTEQVGEAVADLFPHIALTGISLGAGNRGGSSYGYESSTWHHLTEAASRMFSVGVGINWNLLDFGRVRAHIDVTQSLQRQALLTYEKTIIEALHEVEDALTAYFNEGKRLQSLEHKLAADRHGLTLVEERASIGLATEVEVLNARKAVTTSASALVQSQQSLTGDLIAVYKALGGSWTPPACLCDPP